MSTRRRTLGQLREELEVIALFDRVHDFATQADTASETAYANRQIRRNQLTTEIEKLKVSQPEQQNAGRVSAALAFVGAIGWALVYMLK